MFVKHPIFWTKSQALWDVPNLELSATEAKDNHANANTNSIILNKFIEIKFSDIFWAKIVLNPFLTWILFPSGFSTESFRIFDIVLVCYASLSVCRNAYALV